ncbi:restriction endonuclease subunit S [Lacticaseibacillus paracasei]|uniref:restriction endonuclease subunit S n=1 Tax=Lacticaseibacillus paracasei TaxID=1597 RepID=UPI001018EB80|nr:restriction endonuclease subunit S [Lacticaseibacillus paracasei]QBA74911.1 restriction endonuclease subunit S [Lacticaseibacillus paracasei]
MSKDVKNVPALRFKGYSDAWEKRELGEIFNVVTDYVANGSFKSLRQRVSTYSNPNFAYMIRLQDASNNWKGPWLYTDQQSYSFLAKTKLHPGDILMSNVGSVGKFFLVPDLDRPMTLAPNAVLLRSMTYSTYFLFQLLQTSSMTESINEKTTPGVQQKINKTDFKKIITNVPTLNESSMVGQMLFLLDNLIAATQDSIEALGQAKKALLQHLFDQSWRFKGYSDPWEKRKLGEIARIFDGTHQTPNYQSSGIMFLSVENIQTLKSNKFISLEDFQKDFKVSPRTGDILMTRIGNIGTTNVVKSTRPIAYYVSLALIRPNDAIDVYYLNYAINGLSFQRELRRRTLSVAFPQKINKQEIGKSIVDLPSPSEQIQIGNLFVLLDNLIAATQSRLSSLESLKKSLLQDLFI